jgi:hypothetical protein
VADVDLLTVGAIDHLEPFGLVDQVRDLDSFSMLFSKGLV